MVCATVRGLECATFINFDGWGLTFWGPELLGIRHTARQSYSESCHSGRRRISITGSINPHWLFCVAVSLWDRLLHCSKFFTTSPHLPRFLFSCLESLVPSTKAPIYLGNKPTGPNSMTHSHTWFFRSRSLLDSGDTASTLTMYTSPYVLAPKLQFKDGDRDQGLSGQFVLPKSHSQMAQLDAILPWLGPISHVTKSVSSSSRFSSWIVMSYRTTSNKFAYSRWQRSIIISPVEDLFSLAHVHRKICESTSTSSRSTIREIFHWSRIYRSCLVNTRWHRRSAEVEFHFNQILRSVTEKLMFRMTR